MLRKKSLNLRQIWKVYKINLSGTSPENIVEILDVVFPKRNTKLSTAKKYEQYLSTVNGKDLALFSEMMRDINENSRTT